jgi:hypothetical protein
MASRARLLRANPEYSAMTDTILFTDHGILIFAITTSAIALMFSVMGMGLATTHRMRSEIELRFEGGNSTGKSDDRSLSEWNLLQQQFHTLVRERPDNIDYIFDMQFRGRFSELIYQSAKLGSRTGAVAA